MPLTKDEAPAAEGGEEQVVDKRSEALASIEAARHAMLVEEGFNAKDLPTGEDTVADAGADTPEGGEDTAAGGEDTAAGGEGGAADGGDDTLPAAAAADDEQKFEVVVDGEKRLVTLEEMRRNYQTGAAAHKRLETATQILTRANEIRAQRETQDQPAATDDGAQASGDDQAAAEQKRLQELTEVVKAIQLDDPDKGAQALDQFIKRQQANRSPATASAAPDADRITSEVLDRVSFRTALEDFGIQNQDILADQDTAAFAGMKYRSKMQAEIQKAAAERRPMRPYAEIFAETAADVRKMLGKPAAPSASKQDSGDGNGGNPPPNAQTPVKIAVDTGKRITMKRMGGQPPAPARAAVSAPRPTETPDAPTEEQLRQRNSNVIEEMAASRRPRTQQQAGRR